MSYYELVWKFVEKIPKGKVMAYGEVARMVGVREVGEIGEVRGKKITANMVGWALHKNKNPKKIPCHRVVNKDGKLATGYAFGGQVEQKRKLVEEGVIFKDNQHVNLEICAWTLLKK
ncbi:MAG: hypothetical protein A3D24_00370 [Candidatus Blackburnbacteria bacterium RIFCSPHIGHO2_02_FULL_39_13]|uniref:Methylated-DNA-[protein]-cysteine S-methyltransferase DNA binding domain-containing protein n=1 Tax=Candidatus Blackburnbacteria bacterium RIFCSPLOWO2_01_FULL_40_20 TaxID=1797519 RepID=A0A1G1VGB3_9BACT|nr:MAG: O-6-methylguanine DNA methyltransferase [Microgenomates group bacterium GW2011_GWA2_39_19]OGY07535.1 MAG: hypothetical protein A2694_04735 [Candidatus Blackburnbacteria bacterium RIFCSPHIGHO2_01_FULL_40_17]OGY08617.1 MAG: hypothetical protein A3D24_00370 [Candidatus Blackburnbacteria bacterium RIFCSPHIGHO2_02_FULL_39_13]OGY14252.1 MAG: hypothetical protein A3A77_02130 [Candidatus Blackburnbacteria bacterium RIFCSPLOWO2_01_FULL_40_20]OGY14579.1 MAG: hypothetical protein A3I52_00325 [Cand